MIQKKHLWYGLILAVGIGITAGARTETLTWAGGTSGNLSTASKFLILNS